MGFGIDVNILLYASDQHSHYQPAAQRFLDAHAQGTEIMYLAYATAASYLRMSTHPRIFRHPLPPERAFGNLQRLTALSNVRLIHEEDGFFEVYREIAETVPARGNFVSDAHLAALLKQHGIGTIYSNDTDFRKFSFLNVKNPLIEN